MDTSELSQLKGKRLDYIVYCHACKTLKQSASDKQFEEGYKKGLFHFSQDKHLLADLLELYQINLQRLAGEWLASTTNSSVFAAEPLEAVLKLVIKDHSLRF